MGEGFEGGPGIGALRGGLASLGMTLGQRGVLTEEEECETFWLGPTHVPKACD